MEKPIIEVNHLTAAYGDETILKDITFDVRRGEVFVILGGSGCGKSTLLKHMIGLYPPASGEIWISGSNLTESDGDTRSEILRKFGVTYQGGALFSSMTLLENVTLPLEEFTNLPPAARERIALMKLHLVGLDTFANKLPAEVSGGMVKRAAIARAMALDPDILFLDEPSAGLDPVTSAGLDELVLKINRDFGSTFVIVTHELPSIYAIADRVIMLDRRTKGIIAQGSPEELRDHSDDAFVRAFFHREADSE
jgi:phospholipid/cholesterol/gamma-HCH transport system ATP-binding protein